MEVTRGYTRIKTTNTNIKPTNIEILCININNLVIIRYFIEGIMKYHQFVPDRQINNYLFFELHNKSPLWDIEFIINTPTHGSFMTNDHLITYIIKIKNNLIIDHINTSLALKFVIANLYSKLPEFINTDLSNKSFIPLIKSIKPPPDFKIELYNYQQKSLSKMLQIENKQNNMTCDYTNTISIYDDNILFDPVSNVVTHNKHKFNIMTNGGILCDEMGLGKTISLIALITCNPAPSNLPNTKMSNISGIEKINSKATIILCPSHLTKQWENEIIRCNPNLKILTILSKTDYNNLCFDDFINSDIIITSHQFIMNFKFYPTLHYKTCTASNFNFEQRNILVKQDLNKYINEIGFPAIKDIEDPIFEFFNFHRLILDEGHEIFGELLGNISLSRYMARWVSSIDSNYYWYVSGTPFVNYTGVKNCAKFINLRLEDTNRGFVFDFTNNNNLNQSSFLTNIISKECIWYNILEKICIRHRKVDVENQINIPGYQERLVWLKFTDLERQLYESKKNKVSQQYLQQLCCHPLVVESTKKIFGDTEVDLSLMQDKLIEFHKQNYETYTLKLSNLVNNNQAYHMLKKQYETQITESKYMYSILEKMKSEEKIEDNCAICLDSIDKPTLTACGHLFCYNCLKMCLDNKKLCPLCKTNLEGKDILVMNLKKKDNEESNPLIQKYGSKLGKLISIIRHLVAQKETRIIIFSQWDDMLSLIGKTLAANEIDNCFVKGNVWSRNSAIRKFKMGKTNHGTDNKVIMLSLKNAASGTNLTEATHIFFVEPINESREESRAIEGQAIARACRVGQKQQVLVSRILIENTIEEDIYRQYYNKDLVISFEEQNFIINPQSISPIIPETIEEKPKPKTRSRKKQEVIDV